MSSATTPSRVWGAAASFPAFPVMLSKRSRFTIVISSIPAAALKRWRSFIRPSPPTILPGPIQLCSGTSRPAGFFFGTFGISSSRTSKSRSSNRRCGLCSGWTMWMMPISSASKLRAPLRLRFSRCTTFRSSARSHVAMFRTCKFRRWSKRNFQSSDRKPAQRQVTPLKSIRRNMSAPRVMSATALLIACLSLGFSSACANGQTTALSSIEETLTHPVQSSAVTDFQLQQYLFARVPPLPAPKIAAQWTTEEQRMREHILNDIAYHGWPRQWVDSAPRFQQVGVIESQDGYRIRKFRYEIVPGFMSTALLYEPDKITKRAPAVLNLIGHEPEGIAVEYEQKRCINLAKRGIVSLNLGWMGFGELSQPENNHDYAADLNLVGSNAFGFFYLAMRRGLDYLATLPEVDPARLGVTGLSGGGWQTVMLAALDTRVAVSVEVAGIGSRESNLTHPLDTYEVEEDAPDLLRAQSYPEFVAMRAPKPTLLIHNAVDSCCFRAPEVKPGIYDRAKPFFNLFNVPENLAWHENLDPGVHNFQLDNRQQAYKFFTRHFDMPVTQKEIFSDAEIRAPQQLAIGVPAGNLTFVSLAKQLEHGIQREQVP